MKISHHGNKSHMTLRTGSKVEDKLHHQQRVFNHQLAQDAYLDYKEGLYSYEDLDENMTPHPNEELTPEQKLFLKNHQPQENKTTCG